MKAKKIDMSDLIPHFATMGSVSKYTLEHGIARTKIRSNALDSLLSAGVEYAEAATIADKVVIETYGE